MRKKPAYLVEKKRFVHRYPSKALNEEAAAVAFYSNDYCSYSLLSTSYVHVVHININVTIQHPRLGMLCIPRCGAVRGAARLVVLNNYT